MRVFILLLRYIQVVVLDLKNPQNESAAAIVDKVLYYQTMNQSEREERAYSDFLSG